MGVLNDGVLWHPLSGMSRLESTLKLRRGGEVMVVTYVICTGLCSLLTIRDHQHPIFCYLARTWVGYVGDHLLGGLNPGRLCF